MKHFLIAAMMAAAGAAAITPALAADVGVSVSIGQPGFYGRLDIGGFPQPQVYYSQPRVIVRGSYASEPVYLRVPPGHRKHWNRHCREYNACGERVYFVQDSWYNREYAPRYQEQYRDRQGDGRNENRDDRRGGRGNDHQRNDRNNGR